MSLSLYVSLAVSLSVSVCVSVYVYVCVSVPVPVSVCLSVRHPSFSLPRGLCPLPSLPVTPYTRSSQLQPRVDEMFSPQALLPSSAEEERQVLSVQRIKVRPAEIKQLHIVQLQASRRL